ncbi:hybrid sensor histidine kinase/response regulator [Methylobacterium durans]|uniref:histidine kinase n=1 Tax=Methylobacterium durans TaxID=2202825 RepID=A0A2U8WBZ7_9HYPH|nr:hybrid sensor histidine kinase/response regulator [Methylobacterium durans]
MSALRAPPPGERVIGASINAFDWSDTPLGPRENWPASLTSIYEVMVASPFAMCASWGPDLTMIYNEAYTDFLAVRHPAALGQPIREVWHDVWADIAPLIERAMAGQRVHRTDMHLVMTRKGYAEDTYWTFAYSPLRDGETVVGFLNIAIETTEGVIAAQRRDAAEASLRQLNATLEQQVADRSRERDRLWNLSEDMLARANYEGMMSAVSPAWTQVLGWSGTELLSRPYATFMHPDGLDQTLAALVRMGETAQPTRFENRIATRDGSWKPIEWTVAPEPDGLNFIAVGRDLSIAKAREAELAVAQEALRQSQKMEAVGQLTGGVAHDFNNLLTIIRSSVDFLRRPELPDERKRRYLDAVSDTVDRAAKLTGQLLAFARRQTLKPEVIDVGHRLRTVSDMLDPVTGARIRLVTEVPDHTCFVRVDLNQLDTALINMAVNARDAMEGEGTLTLRLTCGGAMPPIRGHGGGKGPFVAISLRDTGCGIAADQLSRIFEPFFTTKAVGKGTGLGLSQVFGFAKQSGGDVEVDSIVGVGTTFTLYLPEVRPEAQAHGDADQDHEPAPLGRGQRILVVEDNIGVGQFATQILEDLGYRPTWVANAEEALDRLGSDGAGFELVFSDVVMPGMGGVALAHELQRRLPRLPVVLASGYSHVLAQETSHGFELLHKPYSAEQLGRILHQVTGRQSTQRA